MSMLYLRSAGRVQGPFDPAEVRRRVAAGELPRWTMSWLAGEKQWQSLARRWPGGDVSHAAFDVGVALIIVLLLLAIASIPGRLLSHLPDAWQTQGFILTSVLCGLTAAMALSLLLVRHSRRRRGRASLPAALCIMLTVFGGMISLALSVQAVGLIGVEDRFANAAVRYDEAAHAIRIKGPIGHRFHRDVADALAAHRDAQLIVISSGGGLLDEAFEVATAIKQAGLPLRVDGGCASACGLMWASVPQRQMTEFSRIGLHPNRTIGDTPAELTVQVSKQAEAMSTDSLSAAGFTPEMLRRRAETPPSSVYWLDAVDILIAGIDAKVVDADGKPVDAATAKWAVLGAAFGRDSLSAQLYQAIAVHEPSLRDSYEDRLYNALHSHNVSLFRYEDGLMETAAMRQAFMQVSDPAVLVWTQSRQHDLVEAQSQGNTQACDVLTGRATGKIIDPANRKWVNEHTIARTIVLVNAVPVSAPWSAASMNAHKALDDSNSYVRELLAQVHQQGYPADPKGWSSMQHCDYADRFLLGVQQMPLASGAEIVRYNEAGRYLP
ncbi:GYF domain-containing protein [Dyella acidiphila]|uniref:DUF4339 domain-containing protein n=1 Tax=Dyella acidiphila TaxID=2775866 RepID=A0ABR9G915_9GAMM|nr:GYF domain-containing protein [Dyella acidiphila]MBE1160516.1 DUF4339 domain-containing protein [Dyella acidiphila]